MPRSNGHGDCELSEEQAQPKRSVRITVPEVLILLGLFIFLYLGRYLLLPFVFAAALAYIVSPVVRWLVQRHRLPRWLAAILVFLLLLGLLGGLGYWAYGVLMPQLTSLMREIPQLLQAMLAELFQGDQTQFMGRSLDVQQLTEQWLDQINQVVMTPMQIGPLLMNSFGAIIGLFVTLVLLFFFLLDGPRLLQGLLWMAPPVWRPRVAALAADIDPMLARYIRGLAVIVMITFTLTWLGTGPLLGLPHPMVLATAAAFLELIPVIGPLASAVLIGLVAVQQGQTSVVVAYIAFITAFRLFVDQVIEPVVLGYAARLHPVAVIFAFMVGGLLFGILGILVAVPAAATIKIVLTHLYDEGGVEEIRTYD